MLTAQAVTLNAIFTSLANRSASNIGEYLDAGDRYMRLALKAQGQCRATLETLAAIKNPPVVFARQANIAQGPQQVNNTLNQASSTRAAVQKSMPNRLLEASAHGERLDSGTEGQTIEGHPPVEAVGSIDWASDACRQSARIPQCVQRRRAAEVARARKRVERVTR
jgi:hypothetical protein